MAKWPLKYRSSVTGSNKSFYPLFLKEMAYWISLFLITKILFFNPPLIETSTAGVQWYVLVRGYFKPNLHIVDNVVISQRAAPCGVANTLFYKRLCPILRTLVLPSVGDAFSSIIELFWIPFLVEYPILFSSCHAHNQLTLFYFQTSYYESGNTI